MENTDQRLSDFQPLSKAANDAKRQYCIECKQTGIRYDAKKLGYPMSYYQGDAHHNFEENACIGCYWYDPLEFKKHTTLNFLIETRQISEQEAKSFRRLIIVSTEVCHALEDLNDSLNKRKNTTDDLIQRVREARKTGKLQLKRGDDSVIADALELYTALFEGGDTP